MRLNDLIGAYNASITEIQNLTEMGDIADIENKVSEAEKLKKEIEVLENARALEIKNVINGAITKEKGEDTMQVYNNDILRNLLLNKANEEELAIYNAYTGQKEGVAADGGYLVPETQLEELYQYKRTLTDLTKYCNVINITTPTGSMPLEVLANEKLANLTEGENINVSKVQFGQTKWATKDYADMVAITNQLLQDTNFDIMGYLKVRLGKKSVNTTNAKIIEILKALPNSIEATNAQGLAKLDEAIIKGLDPIFRQDGIILTNQSGRLYLETLTDKNGRPLLTDSYATPGYKEFRGLTLVEVSDALLPNDTTKIPFFVGDMKSLITVFNLKSLELAVSEEAGFMNYTTLIRAVQRFDIKTLDTEAMKYVKIANA